MTEKEPEEIDNELQNGPMEKRECRDIICCILFIISLIAMIYLAALGRSKGQYEKLLAVYDSNTTPQACGLDSGYADYKYLYFPYPPNTLDRLCIKKCPTSSGDTIDFKATDSYPSTTPLTGITTDQDATAMQTIANGGKVVIKYGTVLYFDRICGPDASYLKNLGAISTLISTAAGTMEKFIADVSRAYYVILAAFGASVIIGLIYMFFLRLCVGVLVFVTIISIILGQAVLGYLYYDKGSKANPVDTNSVYLGYVFWGTAAISALFFCCCRKQIKLAVAIIKTAAVFIMDVKSVLVVPIIGIILELIVAAICIIGLVFVVSLQDVKGQTITFYASVTPKDPEQYYLLYYIFGSIWKFTFVEALTQFVVASTACLWYFSQGTGQSASLPVSRSYWRAFRYHMGSIAFGSLLLAFVRFIRLMLEYIERQLKKGNQENKVILCIIKYCKCYMACFERFIKFLTKMAYIQIALQGKNFCRAAYDGFMLVLRNPARFSIVGSIGTIFNLLGALIIGISGFVVAYVMCVTITDLKNNLYSVFIPTIIGGLMSLMIGGLYMTVYGMSIDTILQCFCLDEELAKQNGGNPQHTPDTLVEFMEEVAKK